MERPGLRRRRQHEVRPQAGQTKRPADHYVYDAWNRLVAVYQDDGDGVYEPGTGDTSVATYKYDGANRRIEKVVTGGADMHYYYNQRLATDRRTPIANR